MMLRAASWLRNVDPRVLQGIAGVGLAGVSWLAAAYALVQLVSEPAYLVSLYWAIIDAHKHRATDADVYVFAQLAGAIFALLGTGIISLALALRGKWPARSTVPTDRGATSTPVLTKGPS